MKKGVLARGIYNFFYHQPETFLRPYPYGSDYHRAIDQIRPQLDDPNRVKEILSMMEEVLAEPQITISDTRLCNRRTRTLRITGTERSAYILQYQPKEKTRRLPRSPVPAQSREKMPQQAETSQAYDLQVDTIVTIGTKEYSIDFISDEMVVLRDQMYPLFTEEMPREV